MNKTTKSSKNGLQSVDRSNRGIRSEDKATFQLLLSAAGETAGEKRYLCDQLQELIHSETELNLKQIRRKVGVVSRSYVYKWQ